MLDNDTYTRLRPDGTTVTRRKTRTLCGPCMHDDHRGCHRQRGTWVCACWEREHDAGLPQS